MTSMVADILIAAVLAGNVAAQNVTTEAPLDGEVIAIEQTAESNQGLSESLAQEGIAVETATPEENIEIVVEPSENQVQEEKVQEKKFDYDIASYITRYEGKDEINRNYNIRLASNAINGHILQPGDKFSFNQIILEKSNGGKDYKEAGVYVNGKVSTGIGGGICQVSSTLYQAALYSGMTITERRNHSLPVAYMPMGRDATVSWGSVDLKFKNDLSIPVMIESVMKDNTLKIRFLSQSNPNIGDIKVVVSPYKGGYLLSRIREDGKVDYTATSFYKK